MEGNTSGIRTSFTAPAITALLALPPLLYLGNPAVALLAGACITLAYNRSVLADGAGMGKYCLQTAIVLIGLRMELGVLWELSAGYGTLVAGYVVATLAVGIGLAVLLRVDRIPGQLVAAGAAICGGTTIACLSPLLGARPQQMAVPLGLVFLLNVVALFVFPLIGRWLGLSQLEFGLWSALAIHDTSSVVATAAIYGGEAESVATTIKLGRTLWLIPLTLVVALAVGRKDARLRVPGFVLAFVAAAAVSTLLELPVLLLDAAGVVSKALLVVALFLVGTELSRETVRGLRGRVLWQAVLLWAIVAPLSLLAVISLSA